MIAEPLALDVVRDPVSELGGRLDRFAGAHAARFESDSIEPARPSLLRDLEHRWQPGFAGAGMIEVFGTQDFAGLVRHWGQRGGYETGQYEYDGPFVIPVDPVEHVQGLTGQQLRRRPSRRNRMRPVVNRPRRAAPRPRAIEQWRAIDSPVESEQYSAYPAAMGNAGAIDSTLLRFPTAHAQVGTAQQRSVVVDPQASTQLWQSRVLTPAVRAAEQMRADLGTRLAPSPARPVDTWLVPVDSDLPKPRLFGATSITEWAKAPLVTAPAATQGPASARSPASRLPVSQLPASARPMAPRPGARIPVFEPSTVAIADRFTTAQSTPLLDAAAGPLVAPRSDGPERIDAGASGASGVSSAVSRGRLAAAPTTRQTVPGRQVGIASSKRHAIQEPRGSTGKSIPSALPWQHLHLPPPGRQLFVPATLAQLAAQVGRAARASEAGEAPWPWRPGPGTTQRGAQPGVVQPDLTRSDPTQPAPAFRFSQRMNAGALVEPAVSMQPDDGAPSGRLPAQTATASTTIESDPRPPDAHPSRDASGARLPSPAQAAPALSEEVTAAALTRLLAGLDRGTPVAAIAQSRPAGISLHQWRAHVAAQPQLAQQLVLLDHLTARTQIGLPRPAFDAPKQPSSGLAEARVGQPTRTLGQTNQRLSSRGNPPSTATGRDWSSGGLMPAIDPLQHGLSILAGAPASAALFADSWQAAPSLVRSILGTAGLGPGEDTHPGPAFSIGERLAAVSAHLAARHGLSAEANPGGTLDAAWYREPLGTLILPMAPDAFPSAESAPAGSAWGASNAARQAEQGAPIQQQHRALRMPLATPSDSTGRRPGRQAAFGSALRAALAEPTRQGGIRPVPRIARLHTAVSPAAMATLTALRQTPPALFDVLGRVERFLSDVTEAPSVGVDPTVMTLARMGDVQSLVALARMADAPEISSIFAESATELPALRALARSDAASSPLDLGRLDGVLVESMADAAVDVAEPPSQLQAQRAIAPAIAQEVRARLASVVPAAVRAALAARQNTAIAGTRTAPFGRAPTTGLLEQRSSAVLSQADRVQANTARISQTASVSGADAPGKPTMRQPSAATLPERASLLVNQAPDSTLLNAQIARSAGAAQLGPIGRRAAQVVRWSQTAMASAPRAFDALAARQDAQQSPIARRVLAPHQPLESVWVTGNARIQAEPVGTLGRRSAAFTAALDGRHHPSAAPGVRALWTPLDSTRVDTPPSDVDRMPQRMQRSAVGADDSAGVLVQTDSADIGERQSSQGFAARGASPTAVSGRPAGSANPFAPGLAQGRFRWPPAPLRWVELALQDRAPQGHARQDRIQPNALKGSAIAGAAPGRSALRSLALSDRVLTRGLDALGVMTRTTASRQPASHPLGALQVAAPSVQLELGLPIPETPLVAAEAFADATTARHAQSPSAQGSSARRAAAKTPQLDVDWVQPIRSISESSAHLAPRLRAPGNVNQALDVWVDAVRAEAERSPSAARDAFGSIGQLIQRFSGPVGSTTVRPSSVLRGGLLSGRGAPAQVTIESPGENVARPALIRPGEHAAQQALRKGNDTLQVSQASTTEESRHKNAEQTDELLPPEEVERLAAEVIDRIKRELEFDAARTGEDGWD